MAYIVKCCECKRRWERNRKPSYGGLRNPAGDYLFFCDDCKIDVYLALYTYEERKRLYKAAGRPQPPRRRGRKPPPRP